MLWIAHLTFNYIYEKVKNELLNFFSIKLLINNYIVISELVIDVQPKEISIAILEDKRLVEIHKEARNISFAVGDIYLGRVKKLMSGLNAAFIDVGYKKDAFLHYQDLGPNFNSLQKFLKTTIDRKSIV